MYIILMKFSQDYYYYKGHCIISSIFPLNVEFRTFLPLIQSEGYIGIRIKARYRLYYYTMWSAGISSTTRDGIAPQTTKGIPNNLPDVYAAMVIGK